jgi:hypothetical protein
LMTKRTLFGSAIAQLLADQQITRPMQHKPALLLDALDRHKSHRWPRDGLADRRCIGCVVLAALHIGFDIVGGISRVSCPSFASSRAL